jgi:hypothetical protein
MVLLLRSLAFKFVTDGTISVNMVIGLGDLRGVNTPAMHMLFCDGSVIVGEKRFVVGNEAFIFGLKQRYDRFGGDFQAECLQVELMSSAVEA